MRAVLAKSFARIHWQNLANFGILALEFVDDSDYDSIDPDDVLSIRNLPKALQSDDHELEIENTTKDKTFTARHRLSPRQVEMVQKGGLIPVFREHLEARGATAD
jgi:aconitate hydratase